MMESTATSTLCVGQQISTVPAGAGGGALIGAALGAGAGTAGAAYTGRLTEALTIKL
jgi:hypothetical protein